MAYICETKKSWRMHEKEISNVARVETEQDGFWLALGDGYGVHYSAKLSSSQVRRLIIWLEKRCEEIETRASCRE